eukprot:jgi/Botrbrau1/9226/Bobra.0028s0022.1
MYGYLVYDTAYLLALYGWIGDPTMIVHHVMGLTCCAFGLLLPPFCCFWHGPYRCFSRASTPFLHALNAMRTAGLRRSSAYKITGVLFAMVFFVGRVVLGSIFLGFMMWAILRLPHVPVWAWCGVVLYGALTLLNYFWFYHIILRINRTIGVARKDGLGLKPSPHSKAGSIANGPHSRGDRGGTSPSPVGDFRIAAHHCSCPEEHVGSEPARHAAGYAAQNLGAQAGPAGNGLQKRAPMLPVNCDGHAALAA